ncbi:hypothetical protein J2Z31_003118 [Sinorhizobium kostiense]|uniref:Uncharacterized protein n=1 Tax=Sinorhizobium kostiense TaxID=76747 RepID=A0ABS4R130_9HYPH|nr:hypothetical protein [Sinorhizobium kostiense]MBP2236604.1 hypothetical protein [Sinorhizobium kostiense]
MERRDYQSKSISPDEVEMLSNVFEQLLHDYQIPRDGQEAEDLAARLVAAYQSGVRDVEMLKTLSLRA